jgi:hypothetical protein
MKMKVPKKKIAALCKKQKVQAISRYLDSKKFRELEKIYIKRAVAGG